MMDFARLTIKIDAFLMKAAARPNVTISEQEIQYINSRRYLAGKLNYDAISVTLYDPIAPSGAQQVMEWVRTHFESVSGRGGSDTHIFHRGL
mgnify:CR=1 FL=1